MRRRREPMNRRRKDRQRSEIRRTVVGGVLAGISRAVITWLLDQLG